MSRKQALNELQNMFPDYDRRALNTLLRANGKPLSYYIYIDNMLNQTIEYMLNLDEEEQKKLEGNKGDR